MQGELLDDFEELSAWTSIASGQAELSLSPNEGPFGKAMRLDFDFHGGGGFVVARKAFSLSIPDKPAGQPVCSPPPWGSPSGPCSARPNPLPADLCTAEPPAGGSAGIALPESYSFDVQIRGVAPRNIFEFKLVDATGQNVWRYRVEEFEFPEKWTPLRIRSSRIEFAWGPLGGGPARNIAAIELVIAAGPGGQGMVEFADLRFRDDTYRSVPIVSASSAAPGYPPDQALAVDGSWRSEAATPQWLLIDFQREREFGGLVIDWEPGLTAREYDVEISMDGSAWAAAYATRQGAGRRSYAYLPDTCCRYVRLNLRRNIEGQGFGIRHIDVKPFDFSRTLNTFFASIASGCPVGFHPKYLLNRQSYWTPVGTGQGGTQALFNEEGMVEVDKGSFSVEPFLYADGRLITWADVTLAQGLEQDYLPIPWSEWRTEGLCLKTTAYATGRADPGCHDEADRPVLFIRYRLENTGAEPQSARLFAAIRPFQVTPTWQHWRTFGGAAEVRELNYRDGVVWINGNKAVIPLTPAVGFGAATFSECAVTEYLASGKPPLRTVVADDFGYGSGALRFDLDLAPGAVEEVYLAAPFGFEADAATVATVQAASGPAEFEHAIRSWETALKAAIRLPPTACDFAHTFKTAAAHILINRDGAALHPGPRRYNRSWIRDGVLMGAALLRAGCNEPLRDFMRWYAQFQAEDGNLPDCADREGTEWLPEFDAYGQFIYGVMEYWRFTGDLEFVREMQPSAWKTLDYMEALRAKRLTPEYQTPEKRACYGLLPESMSHEGYMAHPVHAYWDDFWALQGLKDAAAMAELLGDPAEATRLAVLRDDFRRDLYASLDATIARHGIDFVPGSVEFGDFDPAATAIALSPIGEAHHLPRPAIDRTFDKYMEGFRARASGAVAWNNYSAYEVRIVGALLRLGRRQDALELAEFLLADRRIRCWNQWPEISWRDPQGPSFIGDLPHTWISGEYILAIRSLFAYEREEDEALVIAAGIAEAWLADGFEVAVENLPTWYGKLSYSLRLDATGTLRLKLSGNLAVPPGGIVVEPPLSRPILQVEADNGEPLDFAAESFTVRVVPAEVSVRF